MKGGIHTWDCLQYCALSVPCVAWKCPSLPVMSLTWSRHHPHSWTGIHICTPPLPSIPQSIPRDSPQDMCPPIRFTFPECIAEFCTLSPSLQSLTTCPTVSLCPRTHQTSGFTTTSIVMLSARDSQPPLGDHNSHLSLVPALVRMDSPMASVDVCEQSYPLSVAWKVYGLPGP